MLLVDRHEHQHTMMASCRLHIFRTATARQAKGRTRLSEGFCRFFVLQFALLDESLRVQLVNFPNGIRGV